MCLCREPTKFQPGGVPHSEWVLGGSWDLVTKCSWPYKWLLSPMSHQVGMSQDVPHGKEQLARISLSLSLAISCCQILFSLPPCLVPSLSLCLSPSLPRQPSLLSFSLYRSLALYLSLSLSKSVSLSLALSLSLCLSLCLSLSLALPLSPSLVSLTCSYLDLFKFLNAPLFCSPPKYMVFYLSLRNEADPKHWQTRRSTLVEVTVCSFPGAPNPSLTCPCRPQH